MAFRVLILEDEPVCMRLIRRVLGRAGYIVLEASTSDEAIHICAENNGSIDLLVTDVRLQGRSGIDVALMLQAVWPSLAVLFTSATPAEYWDAGDSHKACLVSGALFLAKPFFPEELLEEVQLLLETAAAPVA